jgi:hypothetical protein
VQLADLPAYLEGLAVRAGDAAIPAADAMGDLAEGAIRAALMERGHARGTRTPSLPGQPPAMESGGLAGSVAKIPASTPVRATSRVGPHAPPRDWVQEYGLVIHARRAGRMVFWYDGPYRARTVVLPERSYVRSTVDHLGADGRLSASGGRGFYEFMWV